MGVVLEFKRPGRDFAGSDGGLLPERAPSAVASEYPLLPFFSQYRRMIFDCPIFRMETDGEYAARLKRLDL
jgi:hypothetical protein